MINLLNTTTNLGNQLRVIPNMYSERLGFDQKELKRYHLSSYEFKLAWMAAGNTHSLEAWSLQSLHVVLWSPLWAGFGTAAARGASSLPPSLPEPGLHSSPLRSIHTQGDVAERAPPLRDQRGNVPKFWNLKPWRGDLRSGSLESVSPEKTPQREAPLLRVEGAGFCRKLFRLFLFFSLFFSPSLSSVASCWWVFSVCFHSATRTLRLSGGCVSEFRTSCGEDA